MKKFSDNYLCSYVIERSKSFPGFYRHIFYTSLKRTFLSLPFLCFSIGGYTKKRILVSGNYNKKFYKKSNDICFFGFSLMQRGDYGLNIAELYIATFLYVFVSRKFVKIFRKTIKKYRKVLIDSEFKYLFIHSDALPVVRALLLAVKSTGIKVVCVQHGVFHSKLPNQIDGVFSDYIVVMNESQIELFLDSGVKIDRIINYKDVLCGSEGEESSARLASFSKVVFVGENLQTIDKAEDRIVLTQYLLIKTQCKNFGIQSFYRLHPNERRSLVRMFFLYFKGFRFGDSLIDSDALYIGTVSSFLLKVSCLGGVVIRISGSKKISNKGVSSAIKLVSLQNVEAILQEKRVLLPPVSKEVFVMEYDVNMIIKFMGRN